MKKSKLIQTYKKTYQTTASDKKIYNALILAVKRSNATVFKIDRHEFTPKGLTAFVILGESHAAIHSFPEKKLVWIEIATCTNKIDIKGFFKTFKRLIK